MDCFDGVFFSEYIECETVFAKVGLGKNRVSVNVKTKTVNEKIQKNIKKY